MNNTCRAMEHSIWSDLAVLLTALGALVFVVAYAVTTRWASTIMGRHIMIFTAVIFIVSMLAVIGIFFGNNWPYRTAVRTAAWGSIAACLWWRVGILFRVQHLIERRRGRSR